MTSISDTTSAESTPYELSDFEANFYYAGVRSKGRGPKLVYRTSSNKFEEPSGPEEYSRSMRVLFVSDSFNFGQNGSWDGVRDKARSPTKSVNVEVNLARVKEDLQLASCCR
ncbi:hypothetical protein BDW22DRAFT_1432394 [Trametopsis cervina]|nr:hypothetical protein BDW22DRAFT_1432394 [Trametopsis cervina]